MQRKPQSGGNLQLDVPMNRERCSPASARVMLLMSCGTDESYGINERKSPGVDLTHINVRAAMEGEQTDGVNLYQLQVKSERDPDFSCNI